MENPAAMAAKDQPCWRRIQEKTFVNWCNEQLKSTGKELKNLQTDLKDGLILIALMEQMIASRGGASSQSRYSKNPRAHAQKMENIEYVLQMIRREGIHLVNIGSGDIIGGNVRLILNLIWTLILTYQINTGSSKQTKDFSSKKYMMDWTVAVLPDRHIKNFTTDWIDGTALAVLINYCDPTLMTDFESLDPDNAHDNCSKAMQLAKEKFDIPMILASEDMCNPNIDEMSMMTYLSYFLRHKGPVWYGILNWVRKKVPELNVQNFQSDWNDGLVLCALAEAVAEGTCPEWRELSKDDKLANCQKGIDAGEKLGVKHTLSAREFTSPDVDELGVVAYAARLQHTHP